MNFLMQPFSVLISLYNKECPIFLQQSLNSIFDQSLMPDEVVLVLDGPINEELQKVVNEFCDRYEVIKLVPLPKNIGLGRALNEGLKHCSFDLIARMDTDDISKSNRFFTQVKFMTEHPEIAVSSSWIEEFVNSPDNVISVKKLPSSHKEIVNYIGNRNPLNHPAVIFRKKAVEKVGGYKHFPLFEDWYLWARMFVNGAIFANIPESLLFFRTSPEMYKRRGGLKYAKDSTRFQWTLHELGIISVFDAIKFSILRSAVYIMPNKLRSLIYSKFLRS